LHAVSLVLFVEPASSLQNIRILFESGRIPLVGWLAPLPNLLVANQNRLV